MDQQSESASAQFQAAIASGSRGRGGVANATHDAGQLLDRAHDAEGDECPALDVPDLLERCLGNLDLLERLLASFETRFWGDVEAIEEGVAARDQRVVARLAHRLKGSAASVSAASLARAVERIEELARQDGLAEVPACLDQLKLEWSRFEKSRAMTNAASISEGQPSIRADVS